MNFIQSIKLVRSNQLDLVGIKQDSFEHGTNEKYAKCIDLISRNYKVQAVRVFIVRRGDDEKQLRPQNERAEVLFEGSEFSISFLPTLFVFSNIFRFSL